MLFKNGQSAPRVAAAELLATLVATQLFVEQGPLRRRTMPLGGITDNKGNHFIVRRYLSTSSPVLMQLSSLLWKRGCWLELTWRPREDNQPADDLTNRRFADFDPEKRIAVEWKDILLDDVEALLQLEDDFRRELEEKKERRRHVAAEPRRAKKAKTAWG